jgi:hypothetical protein
MGVDNTIGLYINVDASQANAALKGVNSSLSVLESKAVATGKNAAAGMDQMSVEMYQARGAAMMIEQEIGMKLPRAINTFLARSSLIGPALEAAFGIAAIAAVGVAIVKIADKYHLIPEELKEIVGLGKDWEKENKQVLADIASINTKIKEAADSYRLLGLSGSARVREQIAQRESDLSGPFKQLVEAKAQLDAKAAQITIQERRAALGLGMELTQEDIGRALRKNREYQHDLLEYEKREKEISKENLGILNLRKELELEVTKEVKQRAEAIEKTKVYIDENKQRAFIAQREATAGITGLAGAANIGISPETTAALEALRSKEENKEAIRQKGEAEKINLETSKLMTSERLKQLQIEESTIRNTQAATPQEKMMLEMRRANLEFEIESEKVILEYKQKMLEVDQAEADIVGETPELRAAYAARRAQLAQGEADQIAELRKKKDVEVEDAHKELALKNIDTIRDAAGHVFDDLLTGNTKNIWKGLLSMIENIFLAPLRIQFQNLAARLFGGGAPGTTTTGTTGQGGFNLGNLFNFGGGGGGGGGFGGFNWSSLIPSFLRKSGAQAMQGMTNEQLATAMYNDQPTSYGAGFKWGAQGGGRDWAQMGMGAGRAGAGALGSWMAEKAKNTYGFGGDVQSMFAGGNTGFSYGGPWGAAVGAGLSLAAAGRRRGGTWGFAEKTVGMGDPWLAAMYGKILGKTQEQKIHDKIKSLYGIDVKDKALLSQLKDTVEKDFNKNIDNAIKSPDVIETLRLYAVTVGQDFSRLPKKVTPMTLIEQEGVVSQTASYFAGHQNPTYGGTFATLPGAKLGTSGVGTPYSTGLIVKLDGPATTALLSGEAVKSIANNSRVVQASVKNATRANYNRRELTALQLSPGTLTS